MKTLLSYELLCSDNNSVFLFYLTATTIFPIFDNQLHSDIQVKTKNPKNETAEYIAYEPLVFDTFVP